MRKLFILLQLSLLTLVLPAQTDTLKVLFSNLMNFPKATATPNRQDTLRKTLRYLRPDVFMACEINTSAGANTVLSSSLNVFGTTTYQKATFYYNTSVPGDSLQQMLYWNSLKLALKSQSIITTDQRDVNKYVTYFKDPNLSIHLDTTWIDFYITHLKAGNTASDATKRNNEALALMAHVNAQPSSRNNVFAADLNVYTSAEACYGTLTSGVNRFYDPINRPGAWNNTGSFSDIHTQSTRTVSFNGGATGGLDDRFDQILVSNNVLTGANRVTYIPNSYKAVGQDGLHFNLAVNAAPVNTSAPDSVIRAIYHMSDHLPVMLKLKVTLPTPLPSDFIHFDAVGCDGAVDLLWSVDHVSSRESIQILRSTDGERFEEIGRMTSNGQGLQYYRHTDRPLGAGNYHYQLRILTEEGGEERSNIMEVRFDPRAITFAFQNPARGEVLDITLDPQAGGEVQLLSVSGLCLGRSTVRNGNASFDLSHLAKGLYLLRYEDVDRGVMLHRRLLVRE